MYGRPLPSPTVTPPPAAPRPRSNARTWLIAIGSATVIVLVVCGVCGRALFTSPPGAPPTPVNIVTTAAASQAPTSAAAVLDPRFETCAEANAHLLGPYRRGVDPEYGWYEDRDGDGVVCERR